MTGAIENGDWPVFGWVDDIRPALAEAVAAGKQATLATLYKVAGSAPRGPGAQMLFTREPNGDIAATGYFSGDCIEGDVASHAAQVLDDGQPRTLHYGNGSPWIDIRLRCGGALFVMVERIEPDEEAVHDLLRHARERRSCIWNSDGLTRAVSEGAGPLLGVREDPVHLARRYDPPRRLIVSGGDPGALAAAQLGALGQFETILVRPQGPQQPAPFAVSQYLREAPAAAIARLGVDRWTAYLGATHEDEHDLGGCLAALRGGAGYVGMIGAKSRARGRLAALEALGATKDELSRLHLSPGIVGLGKSPWEVATGIIAEIMQALNPARERA
ncbi:XdhC family protein [Novosphingobium mangrovi (ex Huang et al. 2023)]|uniref:XdhC family protein n=1 Tax=Novosphingobium mangrovi (ex Huang et al. 2023) TaxID=2976432 RepID=A0ABT2HZI5_9SPHN|nr:XdhC family protein [Novosphingobium mangrovi (ex Huang et al. 2023)]MCT2397964.1 XdhC family protein [Novosphingobium mangrovi (ex Huang et al. 2023)]